MRQRACKFLTVTVAEVVTTTVFKVAFQPDVRSFIDILRARRRNNKCSRDRFLTMVFCAPQRRFIVPRLIPKIVSSRFYSPSFSVSRSLFFSHRLVVTRRRTGDFIFRFSGINFPSLASSVAYLESYSINLITC